MRFLVYDVIKQATAETTIQEPKQYTEEYDKENFILYLIEKKNVIFLILILSMRYSY